MTAPPPSFEAVQAWDAADPLGALQDRFDLPEERIYLDGNSLGALPRETPGRLEAAIRGQWGRDLVGAWNAHDWIGAPQRVGAKIAPLIGARPQEVAVADSTSVNLYKLLTAALRLDPGRTVVVTEAGNFPTDAYMAEGAVASTPGAVLRSVPAEALATALDARTAVLLLTHVHYRTGAMHDLAGLTAAAHSAGALVLWDLSHSTGAVPVDLNGAGADLATGCGYKYLNGGPGAPAFLYAAERLHGRLAQPLSGWMGHAAPFAFEAGYRPAEGMDRFLCGTPPLLSLLALEAGVDVFASVDPAALFEKGGRMLRLFTDLTDPWAAELGLELVTPRDPDRRGSHLAYAHADAYALTQALIARGVVGDFRSPDLLRLGFAPLYLRYADVWRAAAILQDVLRSRAWDAPEHRERRRVT